MISFFIHDTSCSIDKVGHIQETRCGPPFAIGKFLLSVQICKARFLIGERGFEYAGIPAFKI